MIKYIGNYTIKSIDYQGAEIKKLYLGNRLAYWNIETIGNTPQEEWEEYGVHIDNYNLDLMDNWRLATVRQDKDTNYITYESFSNYNVNSGYANMKVIIPSGVNSLTVHYGSYGESNYDYMMLFKLDNQISLTTNYAYNNTMVQVHTRGNQSADAPNNTYTYTITDTSKEHFFYVQYRKDGSVNTNDDRGYISFNKDDKREFNGWRKLFHTYQETETSPYVYTFYDAQQYGYSLDKETILYYDPITATTNTLDYQLIDGAEDDTFTYNRHLWTKKYYKVKVNNEYVQTDFYTFGQDKGEVNIFSYSDITNVQYDPTNDPIGSNQYFVLKAATDNTSNRWIGQNSSNTLSGMTIPTTSTDISNIVWHLEDAGDGNYYIVNENGYYWSYNGRTIGYMPLTNNIDSACKVKIGKGATYSTYSNLYVFQEQQSTGKYGLNNLYGYNYEFNWYTTQDVFTTSSDQYVFYRLYKLK